MAYSSVSKMITGAVSVEDVQNALGNSSTDDYTLYRDIDHLNPWARWKPVYISEDMGAAVGPGPLTMTQRQGYNWGTQVYNAYDTYGNFSDIKAWVTNMFKLDGTDMTEAQADAKMNTYWASMLPRANNMHCRLQDFAAINNSLQLISNSGYYVEAEPVPTVVHHPGYQNLTMAPPIFPENARNIEIEEGTSLTLGTNYFMIPNDYSFLDGWAQSKDLIDGGSRSDTYYTDFINDAGNSLSVLEAILSCVGNVQLVREDANHIDRCNATRGIVLVKNINDVWTVVYNNCRNNIIAGSTQVITEQEDEKYYVNFTLEHFSDSLISGDKVKGYGTPQTLSDLSMTQAQVVAECERQAKWYCYGQGDGTDTAPSWFTARAYSDATMLAKPELFDRAKTAFIVASRSANNKYIYFDRKGGSTTDANISPFSTYLYSENSVNSHSAPYTESDALVGDLYVLEYYMRVYERGTFNTPSPYVVIPGYTYKIHIDRVGSSTQSVDVTGFVHFDSVGRDGSNDFYLVVYINTDVFNPDGQAFQTFLQSKYYSVEVLYSGGTYDLFTYDYQYIQNVGTGTGTLAGYDKFYVYLGNGYNQDATVRVKKSSTSNYITETFTISQ